MHIARLSRLHRDLLKSLCVQREDVAPSAASQARDDPLQTRRQAVAERPVHEPLAAIQVVGSKSADEEIRFVDPDHGPGEYSVLHDSPNTSSTICSVVVHRMLGHEGEISSVCASSDGTKIATGSADESARTWDAATGEARHQFLGHTGALTAVATCGAKLATASWDKSVRVWDLGHMHGQFKQRQPIAVLHGHTNAIASICFSPEGNILATGGADDLIKLWAVANPQPFPNPQVSWDEVGTLRGHHGTVLSVAFCRDGSRLISCSEDFTVKVWEIESRRCIASLEGHTFAVTSCTFLDSERAASGSCDETARIWSLTQREALFTLRGHNGSVTAIAATKDGATLATSSEDWTVKLWSTNSGDLLATLIGHQQPVNSLCFSGDDCRLITASSDQTAKVWYLETRRRLCQVTTSGEINLFLSCRAVHFSYDQSKILTVSFTEKDQFVAALWDTLSRRLISILMQHSSSPPSIVAFSADSLFVSVGCDDRSLRVWSAETGQLIFAVNSGHSQRMTSVCFAVSNEQHVMLRTRDTNMDERFWTDAGSPIGLSRSSTQAGSYTALT